MGGPLAVGHVGDTIERVGKHPARIPNLYAIVHFELVCRHVVMGKITFTLLYLAE